MADRHAFHFETRITAYSPALGFLPIIAVVAGLIVYAVGLLGACGGFHGLFGNMGVAL